MTDALLDQLQSALGPAYTLKRELGGGGMSRVFVAHECALGRVVVVKVLRDDVALDLSAERFAREIRLAASLQQANVVPVLAAGAADGLPYYVMPFVDGASLRVRLDAGRLLPAEATSVLRDVARALAYAHAHEVVHRDIKPENVLLSGGTAMVTDFGIAKAIERARDSDGVATLTRVGTALGTPAYMAPEQAVGEDVDARADVYSWGVLAFEVLTGAHPFADKRTAYELIAAHLMQAPPVLRAPGVPSELAALVERCLSKAPTERPVDAGAVLAVLDTALGSSHSGSALVLGTAPAAPPRIPSIAVLPFESLSADSENQYLADGIAEEITNALGTLRELRVAARTSAFSFRGRREDVRAVGDQLGVATVLEGSVRRAGDRLRVTAQLIDVSDGCQLWSGRFDRQVTDIFAVQDEIAAAIAGTLEVTLGARTHGMVRPPTADVEAFRLYHKGLVLLRQRGGALGPAVAAFEAAVGRDAGFAHAYAGLSEALAAIGYWGGAPAGSILERAREAAAKALSLAPDLAAAHSAAAYIAIWYDWCPASAGRAFRRALELSPGDTRARSGYALFVLAGAERDYAHAAAEAERAAAEDPLSAYSWALLTTVYNSCGRPADALAVSERAVTLDAASFLAHTTRVFALVMGQRAAEGREAVRAALAASGRHPFALAALAMIYGRAGDTAGAGAILAELNARAAHEHVAPADLAITAVAANRIDEAFAHLERGLTERDPRSASIGFEHWSYWDALRADPRFRDLLARSRGSVPAMKDLA